MLTIGLFPHPVHPLGCPPHRFGISLRRHGLPDGRLELGFQFWGDGRFVGMVQAEVTAPGRQDRCWVAILDQ